MFKSLLLSGLLLATAPVTEPVEPVVPPTEETVTPVEPEVIEEKYIINTSTLEGGIANFEVRRDTAIIEKGFEKGDTVLVSFKSDLFYALDTQSVVIKVGEDTIAPVFVEETKQYSFTLDKEGTYIVQAKFNIDNETFEKFMGIYEGFASRNWASLLTPQNMIFLLFVIMYAFMFLTKLIGDRAFKKKVVGDTTEVMATKFGLTKDSTPGEILGKLVNDVVLPLVQDIREGQVKEKQIVTVLTKAFLYAQENTPEAKQHLVSMIGKIEADDEDVNKVVNEVLAVLEAKENAKKAEQEAINDSFDNLKEELKNDEVVTSTPTRPLD